LATAWAAEAVKTVGEQPIFLTWNFFVTIIGLPVRAWMVPVSAHQDIGRNERTPVPLGYREYRANDG
jgi:hypothetical protein